MRSSFTSRLLVAGFVLLLLNSAYIFAFVEPSVWYLANVALHPLLGLAIAAAVVGRLRSRRASPTPLALAAGVSLGIGLGLGLVVLALGATTPHRLLVQAHVGLSAVGASLLLIHLWRTASPAAATMLRGAFIAVAVAAIAAAGIRSS